MEQLLSLSEVAKRLGGISLDTVKERIREAGIRGPRPAREMMLTERDYQALIEHMRQRQRGGGEHAERAAKQALRTLRLRETKRLGAKVHRQVVSLNLERPK